MHACTKFLSELAWASWHVFGHWPVDRYFARTRLLKILAFRRKSTFFNMLSKHGQPGHWKKLTAEQKLKEDVEDLFASNQISASRCIQLLNNAADAGARVEKRKYNFKNAARNLKRRKLKTSFWPAPYVFKGPVLNNRLAETVEEDLAIWLPHELLAMIWDLGLPEAILSTAGMDTQSKKHLQSLKEKFQLQDLLGIGLHGDGVPNNYDRTESVQIISLNLPGVLGDFARMRIPMCVLPTRKMTAGTMDAIMEVLAWSLRHLQVGSHPAARHDGSTWKDSDRTRQKHEGTSLGFHASLVEVRGDWDFYSKVFHFPYHSENDGICWLCPCKRCEVLFL